MKYSISAFYKDYIKGLILKKFLKQGIVPTQESIDSSMMDYQKKTNNFSLPMAAAENSYVGLEEKSSAAKQNKTFENIELDLNVCVSAIKDQESKISNFYDSAFLKLSGLQNKISDIKKEIDKALFQSKNTDVHEEIFYEKFSSLDMVDQESSTTSIDINLKEVILKETEKFPIDVSRYADSVRIVPEVNNKIRIGSDLSGTKINNIFNNSNKVWMYQVTADAALSSVYVDLIIRTPNIQTEVNKIVMESFSVNLKTQINCEIFYSQDELNWKIVEGENKKRLESSASFSFKGIKPEYWRIRFTKFGNDGFFSDSYVYNFGLKSINFYGKIYDKASRLDIGYFYSKPILFKNNTKLANIKVCQIVPEKTSIKYSVAPIHESDLPSVQTPNFAKNLDYIQLDLKDRDSAFVDFLNTESSQGIASVLALTSIEYKDKKNYDNCLNYVVSADVPKSQTTIMRNGLDQTAYSLVGLEKTIDQNYKGWTFDGVHYSTYVLIEEDGLEINLGSTEMFINNKRVQGRVGLARGINKIVTSLENWKSIDLSTLPVESDQVLDPLYPFNHKYLIEGLGSNLYGRTLSQVIDGTELASIIDKNKTYARTSRKCWALKMTELSFGDFTSRKKNELDVFCYKIDNSNQERIIVKSDPDNELINSETFSIITKSQSAENIKGLIFKAVMETEDKTVSPVLTEYLIKIK